MPAARRSRAPRRLLPAAEREGGARRRGVRAPSRGGPAQRHLLPVEREQRELRPHQRVERAREAADGLRRHHRADEAEPTRPPPHMIANARKTPSVASRKQPSRIVMIAFSHRWTSSTCENCAASAVTTACRRRRRHRRCNSSRGRRTRARRTRWRPGRRAGGWPRPKQRCLARLPHQYDRRRCWSTNCDAPVEQPGSACRRVRRRRFRPSKSPAVLANDCRRVGAPHGWLTNVIGSPRSLSVAQNASPSRARPAPPASKAKAAALAAEAHNVNVTILAMYPAEFRVPRGEEARAGLGVGARGGRARVRRRRVHRRRRGDDRPPAAAGRAARRAQPERRRRRLRGHGDGGAARRSRRAARATRTSTWR